MDVFVTGATGFIGQRLVHQLLLGGAAVRALVRSPREAGEVAAMGADLVEGDILDPDSMRPAMQGCEVVYHLAGYYKLGDADARAMGERINVEGTRQVLAAAQAAGAARIVYTSTLAVNGDTRGQIVDESYHLSEAPGTSHYDDTKWQAHQVALDFIGRGAPVIITQPGVVFGPGDHSLTGELLGAFLAGRLPVLFGADSGVTYVHVDDLAAGLIAAAERGQPGESYHLCGPCLRLGELVDLWALAAGRPAPRMRIPGALVRPTAPLLSLLGRRMPLPQMLSGEAARIAGVTYFGSNKKAREELGWEPRAVEERVRRRLRRWRRANSQKLTPSRLPLRGGHPSP